MAAEVARNTASAAAERPVLDVYSGPLHEGLDAATLRSSPGASRDRLVSLVAVGPPSAHRPDPAYRLHVCSHLYGMDRLEPTWRTVLPGVLAGAAADRGLVVDLRSPGYQAIGMPGDLGARTVTLRSSSTAAARIDVSRSRCASRAARVLLEEGRGSWRPGELAAILSERWPVALESPGPAGATHRLTLFVTD